MSKADCGVCDPENDLPIDGGPRFVCKRHGARGLGGAQFCVFCLRAHGDHLAVELEELASRGQPAAPPHAAPRQASGVAGLQYALGVIGMEFGPDAVTVAVLRGNSETACNMAVHPNVPELERAAWAKVAETMTAAKDALREALELQKQNASDG